MGREDAGYSSAGISICTINLFTRIDRYCLFIGSGRRPVADGRERIHSDAPGHGRRAPPSCRDAVVLPVNQAAPDESARFVHGAGLPPGPRRVQERRGQALRCAGRVGEGRGVGTRCRRPLSRTPTPRPAAFRCNGPPPAQGESMRSFLLCLARLALLSIAAAAQAEPEVPSALEPWRAWVLKQQEFRACPLIAGKGGGDASDFLCAWPGVLNVAADAGGANLAQHWRVDADSWIPLPGDTEHWPQAVTVDGQSAVVVDRDGPMLWLVAGESRSPCAHSLARAAAGPARTVHGGIGRAQRRRQAGDAGAARRRRTDARPRRHRGAGSRQPGASCLPPPRRRNSGPVAHRDRDLRVRPRRARKSSARPCPRVSRRWPWTANGRRGWRRTAACACACSRAATP